MDKANPSRRAMLAGTTAALASPAAAAPALAAVTAGPNPDEGLLALCRLFHAKRNHVNHETPDDMDEDDLEDLCDRVREIEGKIADTPARTLAGLAAKGLVIVDDCNGDLSAPCRWQLASLLEDIATLADVPALAEQVR